MPNALDDITSAFFHTVFEIRKPAILRAYLLIFELLAIRLLVFIEELDYFRNYVCEDVQSLVKACVRQKLSNLYSWNSIQKCLKVNLVTDAIVAIVSWQ